MALFVRSYKISVGTQHMDWLLLEQQGILWLSWKYKAIQLGGLSSKRMLARLCKNCVSSLSPAWARRQTFNAQLHALCSTQDIWIDVGKIALSGLKCLRPLSALGSGSSVGLGGHLVEEEQEMVREFKARDLHNLSFPCSWGGLWGEVTGA